jgi:hypothetical protein
MDINFNYTVYFAAPLMVSSEKRGYNPTLWTSTTIWKTVGSVTT